MVDFIDEHRDEYGVEPICAVLPIAPSTYYAHRACLLDPERRSARAKRDEALCVEVRRVHQESLGGVYGVKKVCRQLLREGIRVARCTVRRWMRKMGLRGESRGRAFKVTTVPDESLARPSDLVQRAFVASRPNELWVADISVPQKAAQEMRDRPLAIGLQEQVANHRKRLGSKAPVVSVAEKAP